MKKQIMPYLIGVFAGAALMLILTAFLMPKIMILEDVSTLSYDDALKVIKDKTTELKWKIPVVHELHKSMEKEGYTVEKAAVVEICKADYAAEILQTDNARNVTSLMPCRIALYRTSDGKTIISRMNTGLMSKLFGGKVTEVMAKATFDSEQIISALLKP
jgi:uncharacterized protein (DUF302 family)